VPLGGKYLKHLKAAKGGHNDKESDAPVTNKLETAKAMLDQGQADKARAILQALHTKNPIAVAPLRVLARAQMALGDQEQALASIAQAVALHPDDPLSLTMQQRLLIAAGDYLGALKIGIERHKGLEIALADGAKPQAEQAQIGAYLGVLRQRKNAVDTEDIDKCLQNGLALVQHSPVVLKTVLNTAVLHADPATLRDLLAKAATQTSGPKQALAQMLVLELRQRYAEFSPIIASLRAAFQGARDAQTARQLGQALSGAGRLALARRYLRLCRRKWPTEAHIFQTYVHALTRAGAYAQAIAECRTWQETNPQNAAHDVSNLLLNLLCLSGDFDATQDLKQQFTAEEGVHTRGRILYLHRVIENGDLPVALAQSQALRLEFPARRQAHWSQQVYSQLLTELRLMPPDDLARTKAADYGEICTMTKAAPGSIFLARQMINHWLKRRKSADRKGDRKTSMATNDKGAAIPKVIYQYWDQPEPPAQIREFMATWRNIAGFEYQSYNREQAIALLRAEFGPRWVQAFRMANNPAEEADLLRLCVLAKNGGIWADADDVLYGTLDRVLAQDSGLVIYPDTESGAIANNFIAARPRHRAIVYAAKLARASLLQKSGEHSWLRTGPGVLTRAIGRYIAATDPEILQADLQLIPHHILRCDIAVANMAPYKIFTNYRARTKIDDGFYLELLQQTMQDGS